MRTYAESTVFSTATNLDGTHVIIEVPSKSNLNKMYRVDLTAGRCDCPAWKFKSQRVPCKHLTDLGYYNTQVDAVGNPVQHTHAVKEKTPLTEEQKQKNAAELAILEDQI